MGYYDPPAPSASYGWTEPAVFIPFSGASAACAGVSPEQNRKRANGPFRLDEVPVRGTYADKMPVLEVVYADGTRDCELTLVSADVVSVEGRETLKIVQRDKHYPLEVVSYLRVLPEYDLIEKWIEVTNTAAGAKRRSASRTCFRVRRCCLPTVIS